MLCDRDCPRDIRLSGCVLTFCKPDRLAGFGYLAAFIRANRGDGAVGIWVQLPEFLAVQDRWLEVDASTDLRHHVFMNRLAVEPRMALGVRCHAIPCGQSLSLDVGRIFA